MALDTRLPLIIEQADVGGAFSRGLGQGAQLAQAKQLSEQRKMQMDADKKSAMQQSMMDISSVVGDMSLIDIGENYDDVVSRLQAIGAPLQEDDLTFSEQNVRDLFNAGKAGRALMAQQQAARGGASARGFQPRPFEKVVGQKDGKDITEVWYEAAVFDPATQQYTRQEWQAGGSPLVGGMTAEGAITQAAGKTAAVEAEKTKALQEREEALQSERLKIQQQQADLAREQTALDLQKTKQEMTDFEAVQSIALADSLLNQDLDEIYGVEEQFVFDRLRGQRGRDMMADRNRLVSSLQLAQAGKLKGQGQVSEGERAILRDASTVLSDMAISPEKAREALQEARESIRRTMSSEGQAQTAQAQDDDLEIKRQRLIELRSKQ